MQLDGKHIVVTGAASGIGQALVTQFATQANQILATDIDADHLQIAAQAWDSFPATIHSLQGDVSTEQGIDQLFEESIRLMGHIDLFIANAGFAYYEALTEPDWTHLQKIFDLNTLSPIYNTLKMQQLYSEKSYRVVVTASSMAHYGLKGYALYSASKAALHRFAESHRQTLPHAEMLTLVYPISVRTNFFRSAAKNPAPTIPPSQTADYVARQIIKGIEHDKATIHTSRIFQLTLIMERVFPPIRWIIKAIHAWGFNRWQRKTR